MVTLAWHPDTIYRNDERPAEPTFELSKTETMRLKLQHRSFEGYCPIPWPLRLLTDADHAYNYCNPELDHILGEVEESVYQIVTARQAHPILHLFERWMAVKQTGPKRRSTEQRANAFPGCFDFQLLAADAVLAESHALATLMRVKEDTASKKLTLADFDHLSEPVDQFLGVAQVLFCVVIARIYLNQTANKDIEILYLSLAWDDGSLEVPSEFQPAIAGRIRRHLTVPEQILAAGEDSIDTRYPPVPPYTVVGSGRRTLSNIRVKVDADYKLDLPTGSILADALKEDGSVYQWLDAEKDKGRKRTGTEAELREKKRPKTDRAAKYDMTQASPLQGASTSLKAVPVPPRRSGRTRSAVVRR